MRDNNTIAEFTGKMFNKQESEAYAHIPENCKNHQLYKDNILNTMKGLFESIDSRNKENVISKCLDLANLSYFIYQDIGNELK